MPLVTPVVDRLRSGDDAETSEVEALLLRIKRLPGAASAAWDLYVAAEEAEVPMSAQAYGSVISTVGGARGWDAVKRARAAFEHFSASGLPADPYVVSAMISACAKAGEEAEAFGVWEAASAAGLVMDTAILNTLLDACARSRQADRALAMYRQAVMDGVPPDEYTIGTLLNALAKEARAEDALAVYAESSQEHQIPPNRYIISALITALSRSGQPARALEAFEEGKAAGIQADEMMVNSVIDAFARVGDTDTAMQLYTQGRASGLRLATNEATVSSMLCAFSHAGETERAIAFFEQVAPEWPDGRPSPVCYLLLRDVAAQAGDLAAAQRISGMMKSMRSSRLQEEGAQEVAGDAGSSDDEPKREGQRRGMYAFATFACNGKVFKTENGHAERSLPPDAPERQLLNGAAEEMVSELRHCAGFAHHTDSVLLMEGGEAAKEAALTAHAEKKALGALIRSGNAGELLKVSVSIRMCRDCHECFKAASAHYGKRISCDDRSNLHVFEGGVCSCGERWR